MEEEEEAAAKQKAEEYKRTRQEAERKIAEERTRQKEEQAAHKRVELQKQELKTKVAAKEVEETKMNMLEPTSKMEEVQKQQNFAREVKHQLTPLQQELARSKWDNSKRHVLEAVMVVQQGIRCRVMAAWRCTAGREEQTRMHLLSGATRMARHCDIKYAFNALLLNRRVSSLQHAQLDKDYEPWKPVQDSRQFQSAVRQLSTPHDAHPTDNITSLSSSRELLSCVQADLAITEMGQQWRDSCCPYCYGIFDEQDHVTRHTSQCCYNPNFNTDNWAQRWRCEHCSEVYELYEQACSHEMVCLFQSGHKI